MSPNEARSRVGTRTASSRRCGPRQPWAWGILALLLVSGSSVHESAALTPGAVLPKAGPPPVLWTARQDLPLSTLAGKATQLSAHTKKVTLLVLWATYCEPCLVELPYVDALYRRFAGADDVAILAVSEDSPADAEELADARAFVAKHRLKVPVFLDSRHKVEALGKKVIGAPGLPLPLLLLLRDGKPVFARPGFDVTESEADFVASYTALIEKARSGEDPLVVPKPAVSVSNAPRAEVTFPWVKKETFEQQVPQILKFLAMYFPQLTAEQQRALIDAARPAVLRGEPATFRAPPARPASPARDAAAPAPRP